MTDVFGEMPLSTTDLRQQAAGPISFLCAPLNSGRRLGGDRDEDTFLNGDDCAAADPGAWAQPVEVADLVLTKGGGTQLTWTGQDLLTGPGVRYEVAGGDLGELLSLGLAAATACILGDLNTPDYTDADPDPAPGDGVFYLVRAVNTCGDGGWGPDRAVLDPLTCP